MKIGISRIRVENELAVLDKGNPSKYWTETRRNNGLNTVSKQLLIRNGQLAKRPRRQSTKGNGASGAACMTNNSAQIVSSIPRPSSQQNTKNEMPSEATKFPVTCEE